MYKIEDEKYSRAKDRVVELKKFYSKLTSYVFVIALLAGINYYVNEWSNAWFLWAAFGWGIGLAFRAVKVFGMNPILGKNWEERKIQEFMNEDVDEKRWE
ncbi:MAG: 2TM domain-containing protein [Maribacter sp.]